MVLELRFQFLTTEVRGQRSEVTSALTPGGAGGSSGSGSVVLLVVVWFLHRWTRSSELSSADEEPESLMKNAGFPFKSFLWRTERSFKRAGHLIIWSDLV